METIEVAMMFWDGYAIQCQYGERIVVANKFPSDVEYEEKRPLNVWC
jgi:hypothetical protein